MGYHPRIESSEYASLLTTRSRNSELWFVNNPALEQAILGYAAKFSQRYDIKLYALAIQGNHIQAPAHFPKANRANFMRDFNSAVAKAVDRYTAEYPGGRFWGRRYSSEFLPNAEDIEKFFFYTVLQPIKDGLVERLSDYPGYNCFHDAAWGITRKFKVTNWAAYNEALRSDKSAKIKDFTEVVELKYERLPGYEHLPQKEYAKLLNEKLEKHRTVIVNERKEKGLGFVGKERLLKVKRGALPKNTKTSTLTSHRPRILCICPTTRKQLKAWYFAIYFSYKKASKRFREGDLTINFPPGTFRPSFRPPEPSLLAN